MVGKPPLTLAVGRRATKPGQQVVTGATADRGDTTYATRKTINEDRVGGRAGR
jgi:hypothetical protein